MKEIKYPYSKSTGVLFTGFCVGMITIAALGLIDSIHSNDLNWMMLIGGLLFLCMLVFVLIKSLIPALKNKVILEFNENGIISDFKNTAIKWADIEDIELSSGKTKSSLKVMFRPESDYEDLSISLQWVKGNDENIYNKAKEYLEKYG